MKGDVTAQAGKPATNFTNCHELFLDQFVFIRVIRGKKLLDSLKGG